MFSTDTTPIIPTPVFSIQGWLNPQIQKLWVRWIDCIGTSIAYLGFRLSAVLGIHWGLGMHSLQKRVDNCGNNVLMQVDQEQSWNKCMLRLTSKPYSVHLFFTGLECSFPRFGQLSPSISIALLQSLLKFLLLDEVFPEHAV